MEEVGGRRGYLYRRVFCVRGDFASGRGGAADGGGGAAGRGVAVAHVAEERSRAGGTKGCDGKVGRSASGGGRGGRSPENFGECEFAGSARDQVLAGAGSREFTAVERGASALPTSGDGSGIDL